MKGELILVDDVYSKYDEFGFRFSTQGFSISIYVDEDNTLESQLKKKVKFESCIDEYKKILEEDSLLGESEIEEIKNIEENFDSLFCDVKYVKLAFDNTNNIEYIKSNPMLLSKKIVLMEVLEITEYDKLLQLMNQYEDYIDKIYVSLVGNEDYVSLLDCYKTMNAIQKQAEKIKKLGLSPMETIMYVYDIVRSRVYTYEGENESVFKSRDLSEVMFGDKIVCAGYANIFYSLLHYIGIKNNVVHLREKNNPESGHARNVVYVKDDKYDIDGVYYFDPTWNSKRENETNEYLYRYSYFAKTRRFMDEDKQYNFEDVGSPMYTADMDKVIKEIIEKKAYGDLYQYTKTLNYMSQIVTGARMIDPLKVLTVSPFFGDFDEIEFLRKYEYVLSKFDKELSAETMLKLLNNVRKVEYYQNPELYPYSLNDIYKTLIASKWQFEEAHIDLKTKILCSLFGETVEVKPIDNFKNYGFESELFKEMEQVRLTKVLRLIYEKKN